MLICHDKLVYVCMATLLLEHNSYIQLIAVRWNESSPQSVESSSVASTEQDTVNEAKEEISDINSLLTALSTALTSVS